MTGLLALLDDVSAIMDDVAVLSKLAAQKTMGIAGDDLAVNAEGLVGLNPSRELPIIRRVAIGSLLNKVVLVPVALALPRAVVTPLLMIGGSYLCYEGVHKVAHRRDHHDEAHHDELVTALKQGPEAVAAVEAGKVRQAIVTDVVLSAEIVAVALGAVADAPLAQKALTLSFVSVGMTIGIYGLVAVLVKLDDVGLHLQGSSSPKSARHRLGKALVSAMPPLMKGVSIVGTVAMFLVGGGIVLHGFHAAEEWIHHQVEHLAHGAVAQGVLSTLATLVAGILVGAVVSVVVEGVRRVVAALRG